MAWRCALAWRWHGDARCVSHLLTPMPFMRTHTHAGPPAAAAAAGHSSPLLDLLPAQVLAEVLGHVAHGQRGPARAACRALREAACQAARHLRVACLPARAKVAELELHAAAVLRALRCRPHLKELVLEGSESSALAYLGALGPGDSGVEGQPPFPAVKTLTIGVYAHDQVGWVQRAS
jgi:hypothetical protein